MSIQPAPIVVDPSGNFTGNDGSWATFNIEVGTPPQKIEVLVASQVAASWVVALGGCGDNTPKNCTEARGGIYDASKSSTWGIRGLYQLDSEANLGYSGDEVNGTYGFDTLGLSGAPGVSTVSMDGQVISAILTDRFYVGLLGVNAASVNFTNPVESSPSLLTSLRSRNLIPSRSFGYTAGASYKSDGANGSLTLGGYDASRFVPNDVTFTFAPSISRQLLTSLKSITYSDSKSETSLLEDGILALVDSTVPYLWLPESACEAFEKAFSLTWDPINNLYPVNNTLHQSLVKRNASVVFELSNSLTGGPAVNITLPYASFDLEAVPPRVNKATKYFPLQRANDENSYTLGRTFLQEAFLMVNFDSSNFTVSQAAFNPDVPSHVVAIQTANDTASTNPTSTGAAAGTSGKSSGGISGGAIGGIVVAIVLIALGAIAGFFFYRRRQRRRRSVDAEKDDSQPAVAPPLPLKDDRPDDDAKESSSTPDEDLPDKEAPIPNVTVDSVGSPLSEADGKEYFPPGSPGKPSELPGPELERSELSTPEPPQTPEMSATLDWRILRSELSTPEPVWSSSELPTPPAAQEMGSGDARKHGATAPDATASGNGPAGNEVPTSSSVITSTQKRPSSFHMSSSESESGFTRDGLRGQGGQRFGTGDSSGLPERPRSMRHGSGDSDVSALSPPNSPIPQGASRTIHHTMGSGRPQHHRLNSNDSDTFETRLDLTSDSEAEKSPISRRQVTTQMLETTSGLSEEPEDTTVNHPKLSEKAEGKKRVP